ncbi:recombinase family protein, partial [Xenorhabdus bovienii]
LTRLLEHLREGDVVVVSRLDRLARSTRDLLELADIFQHGNVGLRSLAEPWADTTSPSGKMVFTIFAGIAEFERALISERTRAGRHAAKMKGVRFGRPTKLSIEQIALGRRLISEGSSVRDTARILNCHHATLYRSLNNAAGLLDDELENEKIFGNTKS